MPKEKINHPETGRLWGIQWDPDKDEGDQPGAWADGQPTGGEDAQVAVGWHRESWVQVSIEACPGYFRFAADDPDGEDGRTSVYTPPLSRDEINKMIRVLRRARDQVFGRDE